MIKIDFWKEEDRPWLSKAVMRFLESGLERGGDVLATEKNVQTYLRLGFAGVDNGDPCLVGFVNDIRVGFVFWIGLENQEIDVKWKTIHALGSYTDPIYRSHGIADSLRLEAKRIAKEKGYERIFGPVQAANEKGVGVFLDYYGAKICTLQFEKFI